MEAYIIDLLAETVEMRFHKWFSDAYFMQGKGAKWVFTQSSKRASFTSEQEKYFDAALHMLSNLSFGREGDYSVHVNAFFFRGYGSSSAGNHEHINLGDVVQILCSSEAAKSVFITDDDDVSKEPHYFVVGALIESVTGTAWASVKQCKKIRQSAARQIPDFSDEPLLEVDIPPFYSEVEPTFQFIKLTEFVRKVGVVHNCGSGTRCFTTDKSSAVQHAVTTLSGGSFFLLSRAMGFPPRRS